MPEIKVTAALPEGKPGGARSVDVMYDFGADLEEMVEKFGEQAVFANAQAQMKISLQAAMRRGMSPDKEGKTSADEEIQEMANGWTPGDRTVTRKTNVEKAMDLLGDMDASERAALLKQLSEGDAPADE
jgi:hypothetical protein